MPGAAPGNAIELFEELIALDGEERRARLAELEARDPELGERLQRMVAADAGAPLERDHLLASVTAGLEEGSTVGPYRVLRVLGRGGMGTVYLAERADGAFAQTVAVKVVRTLGVSDETLRRFELERSLLARLEHPAITRILDGGVTDRGEPYLVMEYVDGEPIDRFCDRLRLPVRERLELFRAVCEAVRFAHRALIVHRDLKPENILVDREGKPRLLDFGIAKLIDGEAEAHSTLTRVGGRPFTPAYASPEQILGEPISTASDVYSLGVVLYQLLTGETPFRIETDAPGELVRSAESRRGELPSRRLTRLGSEAAERRAELRGTHRRNLERELAGDLDRVVSKALDPDPEQRYPSVGRFEEDLGRYLEGLPVRARPATLGYRARKFVQRNRLLVAAVALITLLVLGGFGTALWQRGVALEARERAELEASRARATNRFLVSLFETGSTRFFVDREHKGPQTPIIDVLEEASQRLEADLTTGEAERADLHHALGDTFLSIGLWKQAATHFERALELRRKALGEVHEDTARSWYYAAYVAPTLKESIARGIRSVEIEAQLERPSTNYPWALADLSKWLTRVGRCDEAEVYLERARAVTDGLTDGHPARFNVLFREIGHAFAVGEVERMERLIAREEPLGGFDEPYQRANLERWRGLLALRRGAPEEAVRRLRAMQRQGRSFKDVPHLVTALALAGAVVEAEEAAEALELPGAGEAPGHQHAYDLSALARLDLARGRPEACERSARAVVGTLEREISRPTLEIAEAKAVLGECLLALERPAEAVGVLQQSFDIFSERFGREAWQTRRVGDLVASARLISK